MSNKQKDNQDMKVPSIYPRKTKLQVTVIFVAVLGFYLYSMYWTQDQMAGGFGNMFSNMKRVFDKFFPPNFDILPHVWGPLTQTVQMAIISTTVAAILTVPLALLSSRNITTNRILYTTMRTFLNILRTIPDLVLAVVFVGLFGVGTFPGILALIIFSLGILAKLISETIEAVDMNPLEAMRASGANVFQVIVYGLAPQVLPQYTSFVLYVFEINIRASVVLGLVGAGGVGVIIDRELQFYNTENVMAIIIAIFVIVITIEYISTKLREALV